MLCKFLCIFFYFFFGEFDCQPETNLSGPDQKTYNSLDIKKIARLFTGLLSNYYSF
jgi:hypothetical protein